MYEKVFAYLDAHAEDYAAQLCRWVEVPSVKGEATPDAPFGKDVRRMLDMAMADAKAFGYETRDFDGYACDITLPGESEEAIAVLRMRPGRSRLPAFPCARSNTPCLPSRIPRRSQESGGWTSSAESPPP